MWWIIGALGYLAFIALVLWAGRNRAKFNERRKP